MVKSGATTGITAIVEERTDFNIWSPLAVIRCNASVSPRFILNFMRSRNFQEAIALNWSFGTQQNIGMGVIENLPCVLPPMREQIAIAAFLDREAAKIDALVAEQERLIALLKEKRQAVISQAVTKGLNPDVPMKPSGVEWLGDVPAHWRVSGFIRCFNVVYRYPTYFDIPYEESGVPEVRGEALGKNGEIMRLDDMRFISSSTNAKFPMTQLALHDLVMSVRGTLGKIGLVEEEFVGANITANLLRLSADQSLVLPKFLLWFCGTNEFLTQLALCSSQTTIKTVTVPQLRQIIVPIPRADEQLEIMDRLVVLSAKLDALVTEAEEMIGLLKERRAALISAAVTGKIDVRNLVQPEAEQAVAA